MAKQQGKRQTSENKDQPVTETQDQPPTGDNTQPTGQETTDTDAQGTQDAPNETDGADDHPEDRDAAQDVLDDRDDNKYNVAEPAGQIIEGDPVTAGINATETGDFVTVKEDVWLKFYPKNSKRPSFRLLYAAGAQIHRSQMERLS